MILWFLSFGTGRIPESACLSWAAISLTYLPTMRSPLFYSIHAELAGWAVETISSTSEQAA